jgi:hypothetical protein
MNKQHTFPTDLLWKGLAAGAAVAILISALERKRKKEVTLDQGDMQRKMYRRINRTRLAS